MRLFISSAGLADPDMSLSRDCQTTSVPLFPDISCSYIGSRCCSVLEGTTTTQRFSACTKSRSQHRACILSPCLLTTVSLRHCASDAVFRPSPNRPRSCDDLISAGLRLPCRIAFVSSAASMPWPSSRMATNGSCDASYSIRIVDALAEMLLSTRSATAVSAVYPIARIDSIRLAGSGSTSSVSVKIDDLE